MPKKELHRIVLLDGDIVFDQNHNMGGRGAYICNTHNCLEVLNKRKIIFKAFRVRKGGPLE